MTDPRTVEELKGMSGNLKVVIHGSPRQLKDPTRPWVSAEVRRSLVFLPRDSRRGRGYGECDS